MTLALIKTGPGRPFAVIELTSILFLESALTLHQRDDVVEDAHARVLHHLDTGLRCISLFSIYSREINLGHLSATLLNQAQILVNYV